MDDASCSLTKSWVLDNFILISNWQWRTVRNFHAPMSRGLRNLMHQILFQCVIWCRFVYVPTTGLLNNTKIDIFYSHEYPLTTPTPPPPQWVFKKNDFLRRLNKKYVNQYKIIQIQSHKIYHLCFLVTNLFKLAPNGASMLVVRQDGRIENGQKSLARFIILDFHKIRLQNFGALLHAQKQKNNFFNFQAHCALLVILMQTWLDHNSPPPSWLFQLAE